MRARAHTTRPLRPYLDARLVGLLEENVLGLEIAVDDPLLPQEPQAHEQLDRKPAASNHTTQSSLRTLVDLTAPVARPRRRTHGMQPVRACAVPDQPEREALEVVVLNKLVQVDAKQLERDAPNRPGVPSVPQRADAPTGREGKLYMRPPPCSAHTRPRTGRSRHAVSVQV
jgi:hypothetical protein